MGVLVAFPEQKVSKPKRPAKSAGSVTLFLHIRSTTLIAHLSRRPRNENVREERISQN
jgi:hypothetical protein